MRRCSPTRRSTIRRGPTRRPLARWTSAFVAFAALTAQAPALLAGQADVVGGNVTALGDGRFRIDATLLHADTGWDHYADRWDVLTLDGTLLGSRELAHPHVDEQPFTRSLTLEIPADVTRIVLKANDSVHGAEGETLEIDVPH